MSIQVINKCLFILQTKNTTYAFYKDNDGIIVNSYWGKHIERAEDFDLVTLDGEQGYHPVIDRKREEITSFGFLRYKETSIKVTFSDGVRDVRYLLKGYHVEENHLQIYLEDNYYPFRITLHYVVHEEEDIIEKWREISNDGKETVILERCFSGEFTLNGHGYHSINSNGTWADEFKWCEDSLQAGKKIYESTRGATAHVAVPAFIIHKNATEMEGEVYFGVLSYSGNFKVVAEQTPYNYLNLQIGINDTDFMWNLKQGETFTTPKVYAGYSSKGLGEMSRMLSTFARKYIMPSDKADRPLKVLYNSWEATAFDVTCKKQMDLAQKAASMGIELFVVDDGWFGQRDSDHRGLGDWYVNEEKFPEGLKPLIQYVKELGMEFGIWIEPEMVNADSDLYRAHPEWIYRYESREVLEGRYQYMLDLTNEEVIHYIVEAMDQLLCQNDISYIKWDMNRAIGECASQYQPKEEFKSIWYRHVIGFYAIIRELKDRHPEVEFEACASGGGRVDYGTMQYFDEFWTSDNTDPYDRLLIQEFYSLLYPVKYMRSWITDAADNENRHIPLTFKIHCAMCGALGVGMNLNLIEKEEMQKLTEAIKQYKEMRETIQFGRLTRLATVRNGNFHAVEYDAGDEVIIFAFQLLRNRGEGSHRLKLQHLDEDKIYHVVMEKCELQKSGAYLMYHGLDIPMEQDFASECIQLKAM